MQVLIVLFIRFKIYDHKLPLHVMHNLLSSTILVYKYDMNSLPLNKAMYKGNNRLV